MLIVRSDHLFFPDSGVVSAVAVYADAVSLRWQRGLHDCASRPRRQNFFGAAFCPDPRGRGKDVEGGVHAGHGDDAVLPKSDVCLRRSLSREGPGIGSVQRGAQPQEAAGALAADA